MKRRDLMSHIFVEGCRILREGHKHTVVYNPANNLTSSVSRQREIDDFMARKICRDLGVREP